MKKNGLVLLLFVFVYACTAEGVKEFDGERIYRTNCITCHGLKGNMGVSGAFDLTVSQLSLEERILVITNGRNVMASFKNELNAEQIRAAAEYTLTLTSAEQTMD